MKTILVTGCSSGFGREIARYFLERDWKVVATMRKPQEKLLPASDRLRIIELDVTDAASIDRVVAAAGPVDVLVNNAGIGMLNALEGTAMDSAREVFETNTLGTIAMTRALVPQMRERRDGVIVNVTSTVTLRPLHLLSVYTASKAAVNAFSDSLALELAPFDIRVRVVLPGRAPDTRFGENAKPRMAAGFPEAYAGIAKDVFAQWQQESAITRPVPVAEAVWLAATDPGSPAHMPAGDDAVALALAAAG
ncbi:MULTISPECIES: SDR family oxidoreductase [unclassified Luteibacter]|uniref:SDR family oxidoreductase n=1 Tax=Luteibacter sp. PvP019 TaxID=3156436 RepID=UPI00339503B5